MKFEVDIQTLKDLEVFGINQDNTNSVFSLFNFTRYVGGREKLYDMLSKPMTDVDKINERIDSIKFFHTHYPSGFNVDKESLDYSNFYVKQRKYPPRSPSPFSAIEAKISDIIRADSEYSIVKQGVASIVEVLKSIYKFSHDLVEKSEETKCPKYLLDNSKKVLEIFSKPEYRAVLKVNKISIFNIPKFDFTFRYVYKRDLPILFEIIFEYDAFFSISQAVKQYSLSFPEVVPKEQNCMEIEGLFHPMVEGAIANDVSFKNSNLMFISGPNMSGKSTFLKSLGVAIYLAHVGFPVPASKMKISALSGLCTTINISDNLSSGYSHFYAEVMRIKNVVEKLQAKKNMLVIFDELFRGTNVKDAYDGTLAIISALLEVKNSFFIISSHIVEVAKELDKADNIIFNYFEIQEQEGKPVYTYKMKEGVSDVRLGMYILKSEKIIELIKEINK